MIGKTLGHYRVIEKIGEGGMGTVYKAEDVSLHRLVAVKSLARSLAGDPEARERFIREAQAASALNHPAITTIYELLEEEGDRYICMEFVEGKTLRDMVEGGRVSAKKAVDIMLQAAAGLEAAHNKGILHRDIKSANIMLTLEGRVKIMDFGLAHLEESSDLTRTGTTLGTLSYSSPEQLTGRDLDRRSEIFSLGVVLYELLTGRMPFRSTSEAETVFEIMNTEPDPVTEYRDDLPDLLQAVLSRMLEKDRDLRYQSCGDLIDDLKAVYAEFETTAVPIAPRTTAPTRTNVPYRQVGLGVLVIAAVIGGLGLAKSLLGGGARMVRVAVIPFDNAGPEETSWFADMAADEIADRLLDQGGLSLISRDSSRPFGDSGETTRRIGEALDADYLLRGSMQREQADGAPPTIRVAARLVRVANDTEVWSDSFDENLARWEEIKDRVARSVAEALDLKTASTASEGPSERPTQDLEAYDLYLRGRAAQFRNYVESESQAAIGYFERALDLDPEFALAWAALANAYLWQAWQFDDTYLISAARRAIDKALLLEPDLVPARIALGLFYYRQADYDAAMEQYDRAQELQPGDQAVALQIAWVHRRQGRWDEVVRELIEAVQEGDQTYGTTYGLGQIHLRIRDYDEAERYLRTTMGRDPGISDAYKELALLQLMRSGDRAAALRALRSAPDTTARNLFESEETERIIMLARIFPGLTEDLLGTGPDPGSADASGSALLIEAYRSLGAGDFERSRTWFAAARAAYALRPVARSGFPGLVAPALIRRAQASAGAGEKEEALRLAREATDVLPLERDAMLGARILLGRADVYALAGEYDLAIADLKRLLEVPSLVSPGILRVDPVWDPMRDLPAFQELLKGKK